MLQTIYDYDAAIVEQYYLDRTLLYDDAFKKELNQLAPEVVDRLLRYGYYWHIELGYEDWKIKSKLSYDISVLKPRPKYFDISSIKIDD